jgi:hypothetical protein
LNKKPFPAFCCIFFLFSVFLSCTEEIKYRTVAMPGKFEISLPNNFIPAVDPHPGSLIHYEDTLRNRFFLIIGESKDSLTAYELSYNISGYFEEAVKNLESKFPGCSVSKPEPVNAQKASGFRCSLRGKNGSQDLSYEFYALESEHYFFQLLGGFAAEDSSASKDLFGKIFPGFSGY